MSEQPSVGPEDLRAIAGYQKCILVCILRGSFYRTAGSAVSGHGGGGVSDSS